MKNIKIIFIEISALMLLSLTASAQKGALQMNLNYNYGIPSGAFKSDLIKDNSPRGARGSIMYSLSDRLSTGLESGYQDYYQKYPRKLYRLSNSQDVSAVVTNSIQTAPLLLKVKYFFLPTAAVKPYFSLGAGANVISFKQYLGEFSSGSTNVGFLAQSGFGLMMPFSKFGDSGVNLGAAYEYSPYTKNGYDNLNTINLHAGVVFPIH